MPGPGGGSRGGGGHGGGGGFRGGGHGGGGFHGGGFHGGHHHGFHGGFHFRPYRRFGGYWGGYGYGGGCLGVIFLPIMLFGVGITLLVSIIVGAFSAISEGGVTDYQERVFQDYADVEYAKAFGDSTAYEDNILIVFLTNEEADEYYYIAWVGDHIEPKVSDLFGNEHTELGRAMLSSVNTAGYWYSLDSNLAMMLDKMATCVESVDGIDDSFTCKEEHIQVDSKLVNYGELNLTESTVKVALDDFTERTGISIALVVDDMDEVFGVDYTSMIFRIVAAVIFIGTAIFLVVKVVKARKNEREGDEFYNNYKSQNDRW